MAAHGDQYYPSTLKQSTATDNAGGRKHFWFSNLCDARSGECQRVSIAQRAHQLALEQEQAHVAKLKVFTAICESLEAASKELTTYPECAILQAFYDTYFQFWEQEFTGSSITLGKRKRQAPAQMPLDQRHRVSSSHAQNQGAQARLVITSTFQQWLQSTSTHDLVVRVGCLFSNNPFTYCFAIYDNKTPVSVGSSWLEPGKDSDCEATEALAGLQAALQHRRALSQYIIVCLDSSMYGVCLPSDSSRAISQRLREVAKNQDVPIVRICACLDESGLTNGGNRCDWHLHDNAFSTLRSLDGSPDTNSLGNGFLPKKATAEDCISPGVDYVFG